MEYKSEKAPLSPWPPLIGAAVFLLPLGHFFFLWMLGAAMSAGTGGGRIGVGSAVYLLFVTIAPLCLAVWSLRRARRLIESALAGVAVVIFGLLSAASLIKAGSEWMTESKHSRYQEQQALIRQWRGFAREVNPEIAAYILENPTSVRPTGEDEVVEVTGLYDCLSARHPNWSFKNGVLLDPWKHPIKIGMDLDRDGWIMHGANATGVWRENGSVVAIGVHSSGAEDASGRDGSQWSTEDGVIEKRPNKAQEPTTMAVTPPATQVSHQP